MHELSLLEKKKFKGSPFSMVRVEMSPTISWFFHPSSVMSSPLIQQLFITANSASINLFK